MKSIIELINYQVFFTSCKFNIHQSLNFSCAILENPYQPLHTPLSSTLTKTQLKIWFEIYLCTLRPSQISKYHVQLGCEYVDQYDTQSKEIYIFWIRFSKWVWNCHSKFDLSNNWERNHTLALLSSLSRHINTNLSISGCIS